LDKTIREIIQLHHADHGLRPSVLAAPFVAHCTLRQILADPEAALNDLKLTPRVGEVAIARIRQILVTEVQRTLPEEWRKATASEARGTDSDAGRIARFLEVWRAAADSIPLLGQFHPNYQSFDNDVIAACLVADKPFLYACISFPEILKTPAVLFSEQGGTTESKAYLSRLRNLRQQEIRPPAGSVILLDALSMADLSRRSGRYSVLEPGDVRLQLQILADFLLLGNGLTVSVTDLRKSGLSSGFMAEGGPLYHYCFGGYAEIRNEPMLDVFRQGVARAVKAGTSLDVWMRAHGHQEALAGHL
jgi:hypothetical protein